MEDIKSRYSLFDMIYENIICKPHNTPIPVLVQIVEEE